MKRTGAVDSRLSPEKVSSLYDRLSPIYDLWGANMEGRARKRGIELAQVMDGESVLDVATGTGLILAELARNNPNGLNAGIDTSEGMLAKARQKLERQKLAGLGGRVELKAGSAATIPYPDRTFDLLINGYMFDLISFAAMPAILAEFKRVLKPGGRLVLIDMTLGERPGSQVYQRLYNLSPAILGGCRGIRMAEPVAKARFRVVTREYHQQLLFPSEVILAISE